MILHMRTETRAGTRLNACIRASGACENIVWLLKLFRNRQKYQLQRWIYDISHLHLALYSQREFLFNKLKLNLDNQKRMRIRERAPRRLSSHVAARTKINTWQPL